MRFWAGALAALWLAALAAGCGRTGAHTQTTAPVPPPLIARADLFGDPVRTGAQLSPRGDRIAFLAPRDGVQNVWLMSVAALGQAQPVTADASRGVRSYRWAEDNQTILYTQDDQGDENWRLYAVDVTTGQSKALTPAGARADILGLSPKDPTGVVVTVNDRDAGWPDVFRYDIATGARTLLQRNINSAAAPGFASFLVDHDNRVRLGLKTQPDGGVQVWIKTAGQWATLFTIPFEDARQSYPLAFDADGRSFLMLDSTGRDRAALVRVDATSGAKTVIGESPRADVVDAWFDPATNAPEAFAADYLRRDWRALDPEAQGDLNYLDQQLQGDASVVSRSEDNKRWVVAEDGPTTPARSYLYDRSNLANRRLSLLFRQRPNLERVPLQPMTPVEIEARDGLTLVSYLTLPIGDDANNDSLPDRPAPLVVLPHSGPWVRDSYGFSALHQWLANRGYAVLSVNFRGSLGFGKAFLNAGNREWGGRMQDDLNDAVQWAIEHGVAQPDRIAIMGNSYGGYSALAGLSFSPDRFACGVSYNGVINLSSMFDAIPAYWAAYREELYLRVGDPRTPEGRQVLRERSPLAHADRIGRPLLLVQGTHDPRVSRVDAELLASSLRARGAPLMFVQYPDEGYSLARAPNRLSYYAVAEYFLAHCLGGRAEPAGAAFQGASLQVLDGANSMPGLAPFARRPPPAPVTTDTSTQTDGEVLPLDAPITTAPMLTPAAPTTTTP